MASYSFISDPEVLRSVEELVLSFIRQYEVQEPLRERMIVSSLEAISNSINHGNGGDVAKKVNFTLEKRSENIVIVVEDEGCGFDYARLPDPTLPDNILKTDGRGVFLMRMLSDAIKFNETGNKVELFFNI